MGRGEFCIGGVGKLLGKDEEKDKDSVNCSSRVKIIWETNIVAWTVTVGGLWHRIMHGRMINRGRWYGNSGWTNCYGVEKCMDKKIPKEGIV